MPNRKDDHIEGALKQVITTNDFDEIRLIPHSLCTTNVEDVDLRVTLFGKQFNTPIYINAMTGGSQKSEAINKLLAELAKALKLPIATGSISAALKNQQYVSSFKVLRDVYQDGFIIANIGLSNTPEQALEAIELIKANALQIHVNAPQEIMMPEGDRDFSMWPNHLKEMISKVKVPIILKEVGFGMSKESIQTFMSYGIDYVDVSGKGGTNFIQIENDRKEKSLNTFDDYGFSTVESLLDAKDLKVNLLASGGIRDAYDVVKALVLGAKMVGMSRYFLELVTQHKIDEAIIKAKKLIEDIKLIMTVLNVTTVDELKTKHYLLSPKLEQFVKQRKST
jgi:isopentenyl-diphosphate Delta-isomerase